MDYILRRLDKKLQFFEAASETATATNYLRIKLEYGLIFSMAYLWFKNIESLNAEEKEYVISKIFSPTIGDIVDICRKLDLQKEVFVNKGINEAINSYPSIRNEKIGHGFTFEDGYASLYDDFKKLNAKIFDVRSSFMAGNSFDLVKVLRVENGKSSGINYKANGDDFFPWFSTHEIESFEVDNIYAFDEKANSYFKISPYVYIQDDDFYVYRDIQERLTGKVRYNRLIKTGVYSREWNQLTFDVYNDGRRKKSSNGTIINIFENNYNKYIDIGTKKKILSFLKGNMSSVCATIWGHGGVGKTATVQSICEDLLVSREKAFDYIVFASAKDRVYNYHTGEIMQKADRIDSFSGMIRTVNTVLNNENTDDVSFVTNYDGKILIIIDDYETFSPSDKQLIEEFIKKLNINNHKILITTRANIVIGVEFQTDELNEKDSISFVLDILKNEFPKFNTDNIKKDLNISVNAKTLHNITSGRPLFLYQFAYLVAQKGSIASTLLRNIKVSKQAIDFLYGRIFDYLSDDGKNVFATISQLVSENDLINLTEKLKYILNLDNDETRFNKALHELVKLRIIELLEGDFFKVYSVEILQIMHNYFNEISHNMRSNIISRIKHVTKDKKLDNEHALLLNANSARYSKNEEEVVSAYRQILNRISSPEDLKLEALLNLADYLVNNRGKRDDAIKVFKDYEHIFGHHFAFVRAYANYSWANDQKEEAIKILSSFFASRPNLKGQRNVYLELLGQLTTYRSIYFIDLKEELKDRKRLGEIDIGEYQRNNDEIKKGFVDIYRAQGHILFQAVKSENLASVSSAARQNVITGLYQLVNVCFRSRKYEVGRDICIFAIDNFTSYLNEQFKVKLIALDRIIAKGEA